MIDVVSKNGCYMLNVGPKSDGTICPEEKSVLLFIGKWMESNGEAIYDSMPYDVWYEGKKQKAGSFKENLKYGKKDYRFTYKNGAIYIFIMSETPAKSHAIKALRAASEGGIRYNIQNVEVLGHPGKVAWSQDKKAFRFTLDEKQIHAALPLCIKVSVDYAVSSFEPLWKSLTQKQTYGYRFLHKSKGQE